MTTRLDLAISQHPEYEAAIRTFADRDPSGGTLKYLRWQVKVLASGQALAPEIADVVELFHQFAGRPIAAARVHPRRRPADHIRSDLYSYRPQDLATLRDRLLTIERAVARKKRQRDRLYRIEGSVEAAVVTETADLVVRHIQNKAASMHHGLTTKWCIAMKRDDYFDDYDSQNAVFFFFERKVPQGDAFDKVALMVSRGTDNSLEQTTVYSATDEQMDVLALATAYGSQVLDILRPIYERARAYPGSAIARVLGGTATAAELEGALALLTASIALRVVAAHRLIEAIACNDAAPWPLLQRVLRYADRIVASTKRARFGGRYFSRHPITRVVEAALFIHPSTPTVDRDRLGKRLRQRHVSTDTIRVDRRAHDGVGVHYRMRGERELGRGKARRRRHRHGDTVSGQTRYVGMLERRLTREKTRLQKLKKKARAAA